jgi:hypothetical protein
MAPRWLAPGRLGLAPRWLASGRLGLAQRWLAPGRLGLAPRRPPLGLLVALGTSRVWLAVVISSGLFRIRYFVVLCETLNLRKRRSDAA